MTAIVVLPQLLGCRTDWPRHTGPQISAAKRIGSSSFMAMLRFRDSTPHCHWNHDDPYQAPQPQVPEASEANCDDVLVAWYETPFHVVANAFHHCKSERKLRFRWIWRALLQ